MMPKLAKKRKHSKGILLANIVKRPLKGPFS